MKMCLEEKRAVMLLLGVRTVVCGPGASCCRATARFVVWVVWVEQVVEVSSELSNICRCDLLLL
jgi:hypothetical protein